MVTEITSHPLNLTVIALENVTLSCSASVDDVTYSWHRVNDDSVLSQTAQKFIISRATPYDEGMYYCVASKKKVSVESNRAVVTVNGRKCHCYITIIMEFLIDKLFIAVKPNYSVIASERTAQFSAIASGVRTNESNFMYQWRKRGSDSLSEKGSGIDGTVLSIPDVHKTDEGQYYCNVTNEWGRSVQSNDVTLLVQGIHYIIV